MSISPISTNELIEAYRLIQAGKRRAARKILKPMLERHPRSERTWLLFSYAVLDTKIQRDCLQRVLEINPSNAEARRRLADLDERTPAGAAAQEVEPPQLSHLLPGWLVDKTSPVNDEVEASTELPFGDTHDLETKPANLSTGSVAATVVSEPEAEPAPPTEGAATETEPAEAIAEVAAPTLRSEQVAVADAFETVAAPEPEPVADIPSEVAVAEAEPETVVAEERTPVTGPQPEPTAASTAQAAGVEAEPVAASLEEALPATGPEPEPIASGSAEAAVAQVEPATVTEPVALTPLEAAPIAEEPAPVPVHAPPPRPSVRPLAPPRRRPVSAGLLPNALVQGRYRVMGEIALGASSAVYRAFDETAGVDVALKYIADPTPAMEREFRRQAELLLQLRHPHLPRYRDYFILPGHGLYLVMDFIPGDSAARLLEREGPLPESDLLHWAPRLLDALHYLHSQVPPLVHADAKPANIRLTPEGRVVLVDFGLGRSLASRAEQPFAPPEDSEDARSDIYRLGATLYTLLTGQPPKSGPELIPVRQHRPDVSPQLAQALERSLSLQPEERFETAVEFDERLPAPAGLKPPPELEEAAPSRVSAVWLALGLVVVGLVAVIGAVWLMGGLGARPTPTPPGPPTLAPVWATATALQAAAFLTPSATPTPLNSPTPTATITPSATATPRATPIGGGTGGRIAFVSERGGRPQIYLMNADGSNQTALTDLADGACQPAWSPDGKQLVFISPCARKTDTYLRAALYRMNADGSDVQQLITLAGGVFDPDWSLSGLTFTVLQNNRPQVYVAAADGSNPVRLSSPVAIDRQPSWSPDGERILFLNTTRAGRPTLYWMNKDGTFGGNPNPRQVTRDLDADAPAWSPDGRLAAFVSQNNLLTVPWDELGFGVRVVRAAGLNDEPAWSPDSQWLVFESWLEFGERDIFRLPVAGGEPVQLTTDAAPDYQPAWQP